ncbi:LysM peptidoglycan-binding domain-containing protein [Cohnella candidum]|uniref:LysM peptidoglycan-binding domain-containing protein n=1 Tax=Cohnella candidum TaxID=2674991 RepID=UPI0013DE60C6|nr:LysM peptidoglycan-binding domain-containing protein [Cohnella candidum]
MTDPLNGLRFDIYERVHLPDDVAAIEELEEIELIPHMQAQPREDHVLLKGHLLLSGVYRAQNQEPGQGSAKLEHWIPVEISLPPSRVPRMEELAVEIDNFDVDLLSTRSINVTGVLALRGLQPEQQKQAPVWRDDSFTVVHQAAPDPSASLGEEEEEEIRFEPAELQQEPSPSPFGDNPYAQFTAPPQTSPFYAATNRREAGVWPYAAQAKPEAQEEASEPAIPASNELASPWESETGWGDVSTRKAEPAFPLPAYPSAGEQPESEFASEPELQDQAGDRWEAFAEPLPEPELQDKPDFAPVDRLEEKPEEKPELKIAFGGKKQDAPPPTTFGVGLLSILGDKGAAREAEQQALRSARAEAEEAEAKAARLSTGDELEWTKLFLSKGSEAQAFSKVRMCIVQREDTIESIAARYNVQARELQLRNRLSDPYLSEGQVLYIP